MDDFNIRHINEACSDKDPWNEDYCDRCILATAVKEGYIPDWIEVDFYFPIIRR